ncbi:trypsin-like [Mytilus galloprovincialis]|uniref:trypsin-like n=1 Tax=Mytilus galloprovincialis TaxID=29158 RepID=UPI003F7C0769
MRPLVLIILGFTLVNGQGCGNQTYAPHTYPLPSSRIVGGREAVPHSWPWQVDLRFRDNPLTCGGSLIRAQSGRLFVLTGAQCVDGSVAADWKVDVGVHSRSALEPEQKTYNVREFIVHQNYSPYYLENDIAIVKLSQPIAEGNTVYPICVTSLPSSDFWGQDCVVTGWGATVEGGEPSDRLKEVYKPVLTDAQCLTNVGGAYNATSMMCAGYLAGGEGACAGDNGGPLSCKNSRGQWDLVGIVSWGFGCAREGFPAVYANVHKFLDWLNNETTDV